MEILVTTVAYLRAGEVSWKSHDAAGVGSKKNLLVPLASVPVQLQSPAPLKEPFPSYAIPRPPHKPHLESIDQTAAHIFSPTVLPIGLLASLRLPRKLLRSTLLFVFWVDLFEFRTF